MSPMTEDAVDRDHRAVAPRDCPTSSSTPWPSTGASTASRRSSARACTALRAEQGLGRNEFDVLASIRRSGAPFTLSPKEIGATLMLSSGGLTGRLDKLEAAGFIERLPDPADRRGLKVRMTERGGEVIEEAVRTGIDLQQETLAVLTDAEREQLGALLRKLHLGFEDQPFDD